MTISQDARDLPDGSTVEADLCIVGAGAAAISLTLELIDTSIRIVLLEEGGRTPETGQRGIYQIDPGSEPRLWNDPARPLFLGGNTNYWHGNCRPLDHADFEPRNWIAHSGWPIRKTELLPYYDRAQTICDLGALHWYDLDACRPRLRHQPLDVNPAILTTKALHVCPLPSFTALHGARLEAAENARILLHARASRLRTNRGGDSVCAVDAVTLTGNRLRVEARVYVLAAGGIENARLLLASNDTQPRGLVNENDLVGRFFMEHWYLDFPLRHWADAADFTFYGKRQRVGDAVVWGQLALSEELQRRERVPGLSLFFPDTSADPSGGGAAPTAAEALQKSFWRKRSLAELRLALAEPADVARRLLGRVSSRRSPQVSHLLRVQFEQTPDPDNRVRLSRNRDPLGQPKAEIALRLTATDRRSHAKSLRIAGTELSLNGRHLSRKALLMLGAGRFGFFSHHMGTTRMHSDPASGVVDPDCRAYGISNLFIAGCSIFPTGGTAPPTLTIVALALRLADHIRLVCGLAPKTRYGNRGTAMVSPDDNSPPMKGP